MNYRLRTPAAILLGLSLGVGTLGMTAWPQCQRLVSTYREKIVHHPVSRATLARWAVWNKSHPHYHPPTKRGPQLTPQESLAKLNFACEVPLIQQTVEDVLPPLTTVEAMTPVEIAELIVPPPPAEQVSLVNVPAIVPAVAALAETPEPASFVYLVTALMALLAFRSRGSLARSKSA